MNQVEARRLAGHAVARWENKDYTGIERMLTSIYKPGNEKAVSKAYFVMALLWLGSTGRGDSKESGVMFVLERVEAYTGNYVVAKEQFDDPLQQIDINTGRVTLAWS